MNTFLCCITFSNLQNYINTSENPENLKTKSKTISKIIGKVLLKLKNKNDIIIYPYIELDTKGLGNTILFTSESETVEDEIRNILSNINILALEVYFASEILKEPYKICYQNLLKKIFIKKLNRISFYNMYGGEKYYCTTDHIFKFASTYDENDNDKDDNRIYSVSHYALGSFNSNKRTVTQFYKNLKIDVESFYTEDINYKTIQDKETAIELKTYIKNNPLSRYYLLYRLDIDNLGKEMSNLKNISMQKDLTKAISNFFLEVSKEIESMDCVSDLIYTGGDDLIAIFPVTSGLEFVTKIKKIFTPLTKYGLSSFTQGVFITSIKSDFSEILRNSVTIMDKAKNYRLQKNICVLSILTEGYTNKEMYISNDNVDSFMEVIKLFDLGISFFHKNIDHIIGISIKREYDDIEELFKKLFKSYLIRSIKSNQFRIKSNQLKFNLQKSNSQLVFEINSFLDNILFTQDVNTYETYLNFINSMSIIEFLLKGGSKRNAFIKNNTP